jgi:hypothetical protein
MLHHLAHGNAGQFIGALGASIIDYSKGCCSDSNSQESAFNPTIVVLWQVKRDLRQA